MKTRDLNALLYNSDPEQFHSRLSDMGPALVEQMEERESRRMAAAEVRDRMAGHGQMIDLVHREIIAAENEALADSTLPAVSTFDAYCVVKDASKANPQDRGLKTASHMLYDVWNQDPLGYLTVGDMTDYRNRLIDQFPKSAVRKVFDQEIPEQVGFQTLTNLPYLNKIAAEIGEAEDKQASYEHTISQYRLDGDRPDHIRARAYIKGLVEGSVNDTVFMKSLPTIHEAIDRALTRYAQSLDEFEHMNGGGTAPDDMEDVEPQDTTGDSTSDEKFTMGDNGEEYAPGEGEFPHDERSEEMAEIESPTTGETLVVELGVADDQKVEGFEPEETGDEEKPVGPLPMGGVFEATKMANAKRVANAKRMAFMQGTEDSEISANDQMPDDLGEEDHEEPAMAGEVSTEIVDPASGDKLELILRKIEDNETLEPEEEDHFDKMASTLVRSSDRRRLAKAPPGREKQVKELKKKFPGHPEKAFAIAWSSYDKDQGKGKSKKKADEAPRGYVHPAQNSRGHGTPRLDKHLNSVTPTQPGPMDGDYTSPEEFYGIAGDVTHLADEDRGTEHWVDHGDHNTEAVDWRNEEQRNDPQVDQAFEAFDGEDKYHDKMEREYRPMFDGKKVSNVRKVSRDEVLQICASMGLTSSSIESELLSGNTLSVGSYSIGIGNADEVEIRRVAGQKTALMKSASLVDFDGVVSDFMAMTAAQFIAPSQYKAAAPKARQVRETPSPYVMITEVPHGAPINARRMMAAVTKVLPEAEGEILEDGRLQIYAQQADMRDINRISKVLTDVFGVRSVEAQKLGNTKTALSNSPMNPGATYADQTSPYIGKPPVEQQPAGKPMTPQTNPQQTSQTGTATQQNFIQQNTDPGIGSIASEGEDMDMDHVCHAGCDHDSTVSHEDMEHMAGLGFEQVAFVDPAEGEDMIDEDMVDGDEALDGEAPIEDPALDGGMPSDPGMGAPGMDGMPSMMPGAGMAPGMGAAPMADVSQMPLDVQSGQLREEHKESVNAAMKFFRDQGLLPLEAVDEFRTKFKGLLSQYGDETSPQRLMAEAAVFRALIEAYNAPAVISSTSNRSASLEKTPKAKAQGPGYVSVSTKGFKPETSGSGEGFKSPKPGSPQKGSKTKNKGTDHSDLSLGEPNLGDGFPAPQVGGPQTGSQKRNKGTKYVAPKITEGTDGSGEAQFTRKMEEVSKGPHMRSTKKGSTENVVIKFDPQTGEFPVYRGEKQIKVCASMNEALADAERRVIGSDAKIYVDNGRGSLEEV